MVSVCETVCVSDFLKLIISLAGDPCTNSWFGVVCSSSHVVKLVTCARYLVDLLSIAVQLPLFVALFQHW